MSRILLMLLFMVWMTWRPESNPSTAHLALRVGLFFGFYAVLVLTLGIWSRFLARRIRTDNLHRSVGRFNTMVEFARYMVPAWFGIGVWLLGWGDLMQLIFPPAQVGDQISFMGLYSPTVLLGILPGLVTWMGLWWAQFPADRALREQNLLYQLEADLPMITPPRFWSYFGTNFRMQVLFIAMPLLLIVALKDVMSQLWLWMGQSPSGVAEAVISIIALMFVFMLSPLLLTKILSTESLPDSHLRRRLAAMCQRAGVKYRDILLWRTGNNVCNAAVMGLFPHVRYVLLSDVLLETMTDEQIEAVFAHEMGHVVHHHMVWYVIFFILCMGGLSALGSSIHVNDQIKFAEEIYTIGGFGAVLLAFGFVSRQCERQADVYAARLMEISHRQSVGDTSELIFSPADLVAPMQPAVAGAQLELAIPYDSGRYSNPSVGAHGAALFSSALHRVAIVNNISLKKFELFHGSIQKRMSFLRDLAAHPKRSDEFDRQMQRMYGLLLLGLFVSMLWISVSQFGGK